MANPLVLKWSNSELTEEEKDELYETFQTTTPYFQEIQSFMRDPKPNDDGTEKSAFFMLCDSTHIPTQSSSNMTFQKTTFSYKGWHAIILTNLSNPEGRIILFSLAAPSSSPAHTDSRISGGCVFDDVLSMRDGSIIRTGIAPLLSGSKRHFVVVICDSGETSYPILVKFRPVQVSVSRYKILRDTVFCICI